MAEKPKPAKSVKAKQAKVAKSKTIGAKDSVLKKIFFRPGKGRQAGK